MVRPTRSGVWQRLQTYLSKGLALLDAAQIESLGGSQRAIALPGPAPLSESSPDYPGNWTEPYDYLHTALHPWACDEWEIQAVAQTTIGGGRHRNQELFGIDATSRVAMLLSSLSLSSLLREPLDWRQPSVAMAAGLNALWEQYPNTLPCHTTQRTHTARQCKAESRLQRVLQTSNRALLEWATQRPGRHALSAGALLHFCCGRVWFAQLGGLQVYRWREGALQLMTGHSDDEPQPLPHPTQRTKVGHRWTRYLGFRELPLVPIKSAALCEGDIYLLASRGLFEGISHHAIEQAISEHPTAIGTICSRLTDIAWNSRHQSADISLLLAHIVCDRRRARARSARRWHEELEQGLF